MGDGTRRAAVVRGLLATLIIRIVMLSAVVVAVGALTVVVRDGSTASAAPDPTPAAGRCGPAWVAAWQASPQAVTPERRLAGRTLRMIVRPQAAGSQLRLRLSNRFGTAPLPLGRASAAWAATGAAVVRDTITPVTFDGLAEVVIPPGAELLSDPVPVVTEAGRPLAVSLVLPRTPEVVAEHPVALQTSYLSLPGDSSMDAGAAAFTTRIGSWMVLTGVDVLVPRPMNALVAMGDSITDGVGSDTDTDSRYSDALSERLARRGGRAAMSVLNAGISRNELLADRREGGQSPLVRFAPEVVDVPGATDVVLHIGTNDLEAGRGAPEIIDGLVRFSELGRAAGRRVFLTTITPSKTGQRGSADVRAAREAVNRWVRERGRYHADGVFDFAAAVADPRDTARLLARYDAGDGLHLSDAGYRALADAVDVTRLTGSPCLAGTGTDRAARVALTED